MAFSQRAVRRLLVPGGLLLLAACASDNAHDNSQPSPKPQAQSQAEQRRLAEEQAVAQHEAAERAERARVVLAIESDPPAILSEEQFYQLLEYYCGDCHFPQPYTREANFSLFFDDLESMIARQRVIPGDAEGSRLIVRMRQDEHIPLQARDQIPAIPENAITLIADFIEGLPAASDESAGGG